MRIKKFLVATALATIVAATPLLTNAEYVSASSKVEVWSTYNTLKVMQQKFDYAKFDAKLSVSLAQGETESGQLVMTASEDVKAFELVTSDLKNGDGVSFGVENITVEVQKYINIVQKTNRQENTAYPTGMTPDMLLPMDVCKKYGENTIAKNCNQSLTVSFTASAETIPGTYTGEFSLIVDGTTTKIPVEVTVYGVDVSKAYGQSAVLITTNQLAYGELNNTDEMYKIYFDTILNKYKTNAGYMPGTYDIDSFIKSVEEYWDNPNFTTIVIPSFNGGWYNGYSAIADYIYALAVNSTPERIYLEKATIFPIDEPQLDEDWQDRTIVREMQVENAKQSVWDRLLAENFFAEYGGEEGDFARQMKEALNFPSIVTSPDISDWGEEVHTYCPPIQYYQTSANRQAFAEHAAIKNTEQWYYTCLQPIYPYPSHHIDDYLIGSRTMRWMQQAYDLEGYLYWCSNYYTQEDKYLIDPYSLAGRFYFGGGTYNGDGFLFYPGAKYGVEGPLASIRLEALRDGQEDYNLLNTYQKQLEELAVYYGLTQTPNVNDIMFNIYDTLFTQTVYDTNDANLLKARKSLLNKAEIANGDSKFFYLVQPTTGATGTVEFYASEGSEVKLNGQTLTGVPCGEGLKFTHTYSASEGLKLDISVTKDGETKSFEDIAINGMGGADANALLANAVLSDGSEGKIVDGCYQATVRSKDTGSITQNLRFVPSITFKKEFFGGWEFTDLQALSFTMENVSGASCSVEIALVTSYTTTITVDRYNIKAGEAVDVNLRNIYQKALGTTAQIAGLQIKFTNVQSGTQLYADRIYNISNVSFARRAK